MWKTIPSLVSLREDIKRFIDSFLEHGTKQDYITLEDSIQSYTEFSHSNTHHHPNQIREAIIDIITTTFNVKFEYRLLLSGEDLNECICFGCGNSDKAGYVNVWNGIKRKNLLDINNGIKRNSPYSSQFNYGCGCRELNIYIHCNPL